MTEDKTEDKVRIDKWLWAARFYKTRSLAAKAVNGGHIHLDDNRVKPSRCVQVGDRLEIRRGVVVFTVIVQDLSSRRGPASRAQTLYAETEESAAYRETVRAERKLIQAPTGSPDRRPDKRERRKIRRFLRKD